MRMRSANTLGWVDFKKGLHGPAVTAFRESVEKSPNTAIYHFHLGLAYASSGDAARAKEALGRALTLKLPPQETAEATKTLASLG